VQVLWILCLAVFFEDAGCDLRDFVNEFESLVSCDVGSLIAKLIQSFESRILWSDGECKGRYRFSENTVTISRNNSTRLQGAPQEISDCVLRRIHADFLLHVQHKSQDILSSETMQWTSETSVRQISRNELPIQTGGVRKEGITQCTTN
jgi:hypothetical protein